MQVAFRVQTDAVILGAGIVLAGGADAYPAPPATPRQHPKLTTPFSPPARNATCGSPPWRDAMDFSVFVPPPDSVQRGSIRFPYSESCILDALFTSSAA